MIHQPLNLAEFEGATVAANARPGREHSTLWTHNLDAKFFQMFPGGKVPEKMKVRLSRHGVGSIHIGRMHVRDVSTFADVPSMNCADAFGMAMGIKSEVEAMGGELKGSGAATAFHLWREKFNAGKPWRNVNISTEEMDWYRAAYFGGRTQCYLNGVIHRAGHRPGRLIRKLDAPSFELEPGKTLVRIDMNSAFPAVARRPMPYVWGKHSDEFDLLVRCGIATCTIRTGDGIRILPVRVRHDGELRTAYPEPGALVRGTWTYSMIREAIKQGGKVVDVSRARTFYVEYYPLRRFMDSVYERHSAMTSGNTKRAVKEFGRRLYGKFGTGRWSHSLKPFSEAFNPYIDEDGLMKMPELPTAMVGDRCFVREQMPEYPVSSNPIWAAHISDRVSISLARVQMLLNEASCNVFYVDTDSVLFACPTKGGKPHIPDSVRERIGGELGQWKVDWSGDYVTLLGPKTYVLQGQAPKMAGIPREITKDLMRHGRAEYTQNRTLLNEGRTITFKMCAGRITD